MVPHYPCGGLSVAPFRSGGWSRFSVLIAVLIVDVVPITSKEQPRTACQFLYQLRGAHEISSHQLATFMV